MGDSSSDQCGIDLVLFVVFVLHDPHWFSIESGSWCLVLYDLHF